MLLQDLRVPQIILYSTLFELVVLHQGERALLPKLDWIWALQIVPKVLRMLSFVHETHIGKGN
jgi:hypothetical protein